MVTRCSILAWKILWTDEHVGYSPWDCKESDTTEHACICFLNWHFLWNNTLLCTGWWFAQETVKFKSSCYTTSFPLRIHFVSYFSTCVLQVRSWQERKKAVAESGHCQATPTLPHSSVGTSRAVQPALKGRQSNAYCADFWMQLNLGWFIMQQEITDIILWIVVMDEASFTLTALGSFDY